MSLLARRAGLEMKLDVDRRPHSRRLRLAFGDKEAIVVFDQGFGFLRTVTPLSFDFRATAEDQERRLSGMRAALAAGDSSFFVVTPERN